MAGLLCLFLLCLNLRAQTNVARSDHQPSTNSPQPVTAVIITTNRVDAAPNFRLVNGQLYNTEKSKLWENVTGTVESKQGGVLVVQTFVEKKRRNPNFAPSSSERAGIGAGRGGPDLPESYTRWREPGKTIAITNIPDYAKLADGSEIDTAVMRVGIYESEGRSLEFWDRGTLNRATIITTNRIAPKR